MHHMINDLSQYLEYRRRKLYLIAIWPNKLWQRVCVAITLTTLEYSFHLSQSWLFALFCRDGIML